jgi:RimJ/RimL family protein N-acetyltransferase
MTGSVLETPRLALLRLTASDAEFMLALLNDDAFLRYIGDRGVRTTADAERYIAAGPAASYERHGFGLYRMVLKEGGESVGICGLVRREALPEPDLGFALLPAYRLQGYAFEAAAAVVDQARDTLNLPRLLAITSQDNIASMALLAKLGFRLQRRARLSEAEPELNVFALEL